MRSYIGFTALVSCLVFLSVQALAQERSKYAGEETREIKSLSSDDIEELRSGRGWGLAKSAELNGYPGPSHLLELKDQIALSPDQVAAVEKLFNQMKAAAIPLGLRLIELETELDALYAGRAVNAKNLEEQLLKIGEVLSKLRFVHLSAHLKTPEILTAEQVRKYNELRGYSSSDPCKNVPEGHDPDMWKKHNGCE